MNRTFDLLWLRIREYFKHPAEDLRQAKSIVPGRLYNNFGYICKAVPYSSSEKAKIEKIREEKLGKSSGVIADMLKQEVVSGNTAGGGFDAIDDEVARLSSIGDGCFFCDLHRKCIPCPLYNTLKDGSDVCEKYKYVILKKQR